MAKYKDERQRLMYLFICAFIAGICSGSFANVLIYRIPRNIPIVFGASSCIKCGKRIKPSGLIPVLGYVLLKGRCGWCGEIISAKYPVVEMLCALFAVFSLWKYGLTAFGLVNFSVFIILLTISFIDAEHMIIPNCLVIALLIQTIVYVAFVYQMTGDISAGSRVAGFFAISAPMLLLSIIIPNAFGGGDIKLIAVCGFLLGLKLAILAAFIAVVLGGVNGVYIKYIKRDKSASHIAFGQYICIGVFISMTYGYYILRWYMGFLII